MVDIEENGEFTTVSVPTIWIEGDQVSWPTSKHSKMTKCSPKSDWKRFKILKTRLNRSSKEIADQYADRSTTESEGIYSIGSSLTFYP